MPTGSGRVRGIEYSPIPIDIQDRIWAYMDKHDIPYVKWVAMMAGIDSPAWNSGVKRLLSCGKAFIPKRMMDAMFRQLKSPPDFAKTPLDHNQSYRPTTKKLIADAISMKVDGFPTNTISSKLHVCNERLYRILRENIRPIDADRLKDMLLLSEAGVSVEYICAKLRLTPQEVKHYRKEERCPRCGDSGTTATGTPYEMKCPACDDTSKKEKP